MTVKINLSENEYNFFSKCAAKNKISVSEFLLNLALEKIEEDKLLKNSYEIMKERAEVYKALAE